MKVMHITATYDAPAAKAWEIVSDFGNLGRWNPAVISCSSEGSGVGMTRTFSTPAATLTERLVALDPKAMSLTYEVVSGGTIKVRDGLMTIAVAADGMGCVVSWDVDGEPDGVSLEELRDQTTKRYSGRLEDLRRTLAAQRG